ncbi:MAG TPA: hypothetical protein VNY52_12660 [Solirubrobacteraceae bacterium]|nr:hypothetical protein [Solirubrobacteraceae bacterium]
MTRTAELARLAVALAGHQPPLLSGRGGDDIALLAVRLQRG